MKNSFTILIVDDDPDIIAIYESILQNAGHVIHSQTSSVKALDSINELRPDVLILDLMMPDMDGLELLNRIRKMDDLDDLKIVVISAKSYEYDRKRALALGADGFIRKSTSAENLLEEVEQIVEDKITMTYWGVRGTLPVPGRNTLKYGGNTSCVTLEFAKEPFLIFDAGTGIKVLSDALMASEKKRIEAKLLISHPHWDHINALPFFAPLYQPGNDIEILGPSHGHISMRELIYAQMDDVYFPITAREFGAHVHYRDLREETFQINDIVVNTMLLSHPGACLGYKVSYKGRVICYVTDNELFLDNDPAHNPSYTKKLIEFVKNADVLITDCTYLDSEYSSRIGWGHSCVSQVVNMADRAGISALHLYHHDPAQGDTDIDIKLEQASSLLQKLDSKTECLAPAEGQVVEFH